MILKMRRDIKSLNAEIQRRKIVRVPGALTRVSSRGTSVRPISTSGTGNQSTTNKTGSYWQ